MIESFFARTVMLWDKCMSSKGVYETYVSVRNFYQATDYLCTLLTDARKRRIALLLSMCACACSDRNSMRQGLRCPGLLLYKYKFRRCVVLPSDRKGVAV